MKNATFSVLVLEIWFFILETLLFFNDNCLLHFRPREITERKRAGKSDDEVWLWSNIYRLKVIRKSQQIVKHFSIEMKKWRYCNTSNKPPLGGGWIWKFASCTAPIMLARNVIPTPGGIFSLRNLTGYGWYVTVNVTVFSKSRLRRLRFSGYGHFRNQMSVT